MLGCSKCNCSITTDAAGCRMLPHFVCSAFSRHNGRYIQTKGLMEQDLMDKVLGYLKDHERSGKPFYMYYAPHAIHQ